MKISEDVIEFYVPHADDDGVDDDDEDDGWWQKSMQNEKPRTRLKRIRQFFFKQEN